MDDKSPVAVEEIHKTLSAEETSQPAGSNLPSTPEDTETSPPTEQSISAKLEASEKQAKEYYDRLLRVSADYENFRKRSSREMKDITKFANEELLKEMLNVVDNLERALCVGEQENRPDDPLLKGVTLTLSEVLRILERQNVKPVDTMGKPFDPNFHQAMMQQENVDLPPNTVICELQKGYMIHERLLRPAMVMVSRAAEVKPTTDDK
jgi:molecular chaperone GrpE